MLHYSLYQDSHVCGFYTSSSSQFEPPHFKSQDPHVICGYHIGEPKSRCKLNRQIPTHRDR